VVTPLDGLVAALPEGTVDFRVGADPNTELTPAEKGFEVRAVCYDASGTVIGSAPLRGGTVQWIGDDLPEGVTRSTLHTVEITGTFVPRDSGEHVFGTRGTGALTLTVAGETLYDGIHRVTGSADPGEAFFGNPLERGRITLTAGEPVEVSLRQVPETLGDDQPVLGVSFSLCHLGPRRDPEELIAEAVESARAADTAIVVVGTTERVESEGFDRTDLRLPGHQDDLVRAVAAANPNTVVIVNSGSPVELPWRDEVAAVLLAWFPGQEAGHALADVLLGAAEPGGRLPTTWPAALADVPVSNTVPTDGELHYDEGVFVGYRAWEKAGTAPAYPFGHGLGYTTWEYESLTAGPDSATVRVRNTGTRPGAETVQLYLAPRDDTAERPARWLAGFARIEAAPGESAEAVIALERRAYEIWDEEAYDWVAVPGGYEVQAARSLGDVRLTATVDIER
ncbi:glycoside hydrolase family 3 C-terminal domain-containing protein, partial [Streptomyces sp. NPDC088135]